MQKNRKGWIWRWMFTSVLSLMAGVWLTGCGKTASDFIKGDTKGTSQSFAVAYLGYVEEGDRQDIEGWIRKNCPILCADYPFLTGIPEERIVGKEPAELYCIIPGDSNISVEVDHMELNLEEGIMEKDACLYQSDSKEPFLVLCNGEREGQNKTQILFQDASGTQTIWYPLMGENGQVMVPITEESTCLAKDITQYGELGSERYYDWYGRPCLLRRSSCRTPAGRSG